VFRGGTFGILDRGGDGMSGGGLLTAGLVLCLFGLGQASASDRLGTVGVFKSVGFANCGAPIMEQLKGACDPPTVSGNLPAPERAKTHLQRAVALIGLGREEAASAAVNEALKADPRYVDALVFRVRLSMSLMMADAMDRDLNAGLLVAPDNPFLLATRADITLVNGDAAGAMRDISAALKQQPDDTDMLRIRARVYMAIDQLDDAKNDLDRVLQLDPAERRALLLRSQLHLRRGEFDLAVADASAMLDKGRYDPSALETRALAYAALGRNAESVDDLTMVLGKPGEVTAASPVFAHQGRLFVQRAILLVRLGRSEEANRDLDMIVKAGGKRSLLRMQVYLRKNGFKEVSIDGQRSAPFDSALEMCFINQACGRGLVRSL
jgi:tetratricopeptide (TPR) repeat protein